MKAGQWCVTKDNDDWMEAPAFDTREEAVAGAAQALELGPGSTFWVGCAYPAASALSAELVVDALDSHAVDEAPDGADGYDISDESRHELDTLLKAWAEKHGVRPLWFDILDTEERTVAPA
ncbi:hypothetical protein [Myxococcus sp. NMCA1]|uniref:hypothetical protein n=1 Tax=Myxococcus sp. NMCA1 TaxID=2996785 RepID=UPI002285BB1C|nr:hypothetical protein [Myxococcus sp. NMCA1]WAM23772.1 hypothetical protein OZ403_24855 [Myxococcus sp. NMCA1]